MTKRAAEQNNVNQEVIIRFSDREIYGIGAIPLLMGLTSLIAPDLINKADNPIWAVQTIGLIFTLCGIAVIYYLKNSYLMKADEKGISWRESEKKHCIEWREIPQVEINDNTGERSGIIYSQIKILGLKSQTLAVLQLRPHNVEINDLFTKFIQSRAKTLDMRSG